LMNFSARGLSNNANLTFGMSWQNRIRT
jgi:hypothetical protein